MVCSACKPTPNDAPHHAIVSDGCSFCVVVICISQYSYVRKQAIDRDKAIREHRGCK